VVQPSQRYYFNNSRREEWQHVTTNRSTPITMALPQSKRKERRETKPEGCWNVKALSTRVMAKT
jgi:hypothetical protein